LTTHLKEDLELLLNGLSCTVHEALGAVAALEEEALAGRDLRELLAELVDLGRRDERGKAADCGRQEAGREEGEDEAGGESEIEMIYKERDSAVRWRDLGSCG
jgi:hypothetical protein